jgi:glycerate dehydrogenase
MSERIVVLDGFALNPGDLSWADLEAIGEVQVYDRTPESQIEPRAGNATAVLTNKTPLRSATLERLPQLRYIGVLATGYDIVDVKAAASRNITVTNIPTYGTASVAQFTFALLLELCHHVQRHADDVRSGGWSRNPDWSYHLAPLVELAGKTMGLIGYGRIGQNVGQIARAFGMQVIAHDVAMSGMDELVGLDDLLRTADAVSLHCPLTENNRGLIRTETLSLMKPSALLINTARGPLVVAEDLADALNGDRLAGAALDVLQAEPPQPNNPLLHAKNCLVTPHIAWATKEARARLMGIAVENLRLFLEGRPRNLVSAAG